VVPLNQSATDELAPNGWPTHRLKGFREGEKSALTAVYRDHVEALLAFLQHGFSFDSRGRALRFAGFRSRFELHDAAQETFRRAFERDARMSYDGLRPFGAWLNVIARNVVLKEYRRNERLFLDANGSHEVEAALSRAANASEEPESDLHRARIRALVRTFLDTLTAEERRLLHVRFIEGIGQRDAAEQLAIGRQRLRGQELKLRERLVRFLLAHERGLGGQNPQGGSVFLLLAGSSQLGAWLDAAWFQACSAALPLAKRGCP
jgi:RNA polymerase sigma-70 factor (ECF subfamily)